VIEAFLIFIAAGWIIYEAVYRIIAPSPVEKVAIGAAVMAVSAVVNILVSRKLYKVAKKTDSIALEADALHLKNRCVHFPGRCGRIIAVMDNRLASARSLLQ